MCLALFYMELEEHGHEKKASVHFSLPSQNNEHQVTR